MLLTRIVTIFISTLLLQACLPAMLLGEQMLIQNMNSKSKPVKTANNNSTDSNHLSKISYVTICSMATTRTVSGKKIWTTQKSLDEYVKEAKRRGLNCNVGISDAVDRTSQKNDTVSNNNLSSNIKKPVPFTRDEATELLFASSRYTKPENVYNLGMDAGVIKYCPNLSGTDFNRRRENMLNWVRLGSTEFEKYDGRKGFLNKRQFNKLKNIFEDGEAKGLRDAKIMKRDRYYKKTLCPEILSEDENNKGPKRKLINLIRQ